ncbi:hypothetical protein J6590_064904 [Homalodisca vitripennis]|nr:hypothetical protein J6590_064904 [Homalodisca vitripennis]
MAQSNFVEVSMGVPQGSILGPLLFALYVNDLSSCVPEARDTQYADDTTTRLTSLRLIQYVSWAFIWMLVFLVVSM